MENLAGKHIKGYDIRERIAAGGFGAVYKAYQSTVGREVAIKIILPSLANKPDFIRRFEAEAQLIARLEHMHIVPLHDYWRDPDGAYLVMRYLRGGSLHNRINTEGAFNIEDAVKMFTQVSQGLHIAHRSQVIHRDIKPGNILLDEDGNAYLADFGIAKDHAVKQSITEPESLIGSPEYLAPEQARSEPVTPQTDIYSMGVILYEMLAGEHPFPGLDKITYIYKHLNDPLPEITALDSEICDNVNAVIEKATQKDPRYRYHDILEMSQALLQAAKLDTTPTPTSLVELLTPREQEVMQLLISGKSNREIADILVLAESTVKSYNKSIYKKLRVRSRVQAIARARDLNFVIEKPKTSTGTTIHTGNLPEPENPYKGLRAFQAADEQNFYGRERLTQKLLARLAENEPYARFLSIVGPSGSGKSSVVKAGLVPALWRGAISGSQNWYIVEMLPGAHPIDELEIALFQIATDRSLNLREQLNRDARGLIRASEMLLPVDEGELLLVIDQFEEVFTLVDDETQRQHFLALLKTAVTDTRSRVRVVVTLRADYYDKPLLYPEFGELVRSRVETVLPLSAEELEEAMIEPARKVAIYFEDGLVSRIVSDVHYQPGALPLLQYALTELFERRNVRMLTLEAYEAIGGTGGALANRADELYLQGDEHYQDMIRQLFLRLVTLGEGAEDTRRRVARSELIAIAIDPDAMDEIIDTYTDSRLLSLDNDADTREPTVEVAHEAILREWDRLRRWLNESREDIRQERLINQAADAWYNNNYDKSYLLTGSRLKTAQSWREQTELALTHIEDSYIQTSIAEAQAKEIAEVERQQRESALEKRSQTILRALVGVFALATILSGTFGLFALNSRNAEAKARQDALIQASIGLAALAENELEGTSPERGVLLALEAIENYPYTPQAIIALARVVDEYRSHRVFEGGDMNQAAFDIAAWSPDGIRIAAGGIGVPNDIVIWDAESGDRLLGLREEAEDCLIPEVDQLSWSASSDRLASVGCHVIIWDAITGERELMLTGYQSEAISVDWSPDGSALLTGHDDGVARVWDASTGTILLTLSKHNGTIYDAIWSPDGRRIATTGQNGTIEIHDASTGNQEKSLTGHVGSVFSLDWSPDSRRLVSGGDDGLPRIWDVSSGETLVVLAGHTDRIVAVDWSNDGRIASLSFDTTATVWDSATGSPIFQIRNVSPGRGGYVSFSPDGAELLVTNVELQEGRVWAWDTSIPTPKLFGHSVGDQYFGAWSPDGSVIATNSFDSTLRLWDAVTGEQLNLIDMSSHREIWFSDWSPDGTRIVTPVWFPDAFKVWDINTGELLAEYPVTEGQHALVARWSPDGTRITATEGGVPQMPVQVWDVNTGNKLHTLQPDADCMQSWANWSPDSTSIITGCWEFAEPGLNTPARVWDAETGEILMSLESEHGWSYHGEWSPDGTQIAVTYEKGIVNIWDAETYEVQLTFASHLSQVFYAAWSPDGTLMASRDQTGVVKIWDTTTAQEVMSFTVPGGEGMISWSPDGSYVIVTGGFNVPIIKRVWRSTDELVAHAYACCVTRELTPEERNQFGLPQR